MVKKFIKTYFIVFSVFSLLLAPAMFVSANHIKGTYLYDNMGQMWISSAKNYSGLAYVNSNNCSSDETGAYTRIKNATTGTSEMSRWGSGISASQYTCNGSGIASNLVDIDLKYSSSGYYGGENFDYTNSSAFCAYWGVSYPCGKRSEIKIHTGWWDAATSLSRQRIIMHETGHSFGLGHHCSGNAIMNTGASDCNSSAWTSVMSYQPTDRTGINNVY